MPGPSPQLPGSMNLNWKKPLVYCLLPILIVLAFVGFPPPFAPLRPTKAAQEQSQQVERKDRRA